LLLLTIPGLLILPYGSSYNEHKGNDLETQITNQTLLLFNDTIRGEKNGTLNSNFIDKQITVPTGVLVLTILAIVLSDFCADGLQNPSRAYLLDVCPEG